MSKMGGSQSDHGDAVAYFDDMNLKPELIHGIYAYGFESPSATQQRAIMPIMTGRDVLIQAYPDSGKTCSICISIIQRINLSSKACQAIILVSKDGLAQQIQDFVVAIANFTNVTCCACVTAACNMEFLQGGSPQIVVGTPSCIQEAIQQGYLLTDFVKTFVLDEADKILSCGFGDQVHDIFRLLPQPTQVALFSTTVPQSVLEITTVLMRDPIQIVIEKKGISLEGVKQFYIYHETEESKLDTISDLYERITGRQTIIFCNFRKKLEWLVNKFTAQEFRFSAMHGDMAATERASILAKFRSGSDPVLLATNLLARGIDVQQVPVIINYDFPVDHETYIYRVGRGGPSGRKGIAINLITPSEVPLLRKVEQFHSTKMEKLAIDQPYMNTLFGVEGGGFGAQVD